MRTVYRILTAVLFVLAVTRAATVQAQYNVEKQLGSKALGLLQFNSPVAVVSDAHGFFYVSDMSILYKLSPSGEFVSQWKHPNEYITSLAIDENQNLIVGSSNRMFRLTSDLVLINEFSNIGYEDGQFQQIFDVAVDNNNDIYILDRISGVAPSQGTYRVQVFSSEGTFLRKPVTLEAGYYNNESDYSIKIINKLAIGYDKIALIGYTFGSGVSGSGQLKIYSTSGLLQNSIESLGVYLNQFNYPNGVAFDNDGNILICDYARVMKLAAEGEYLSFFPLFNENSFAYRNFTDIAVEPSGNLLLVDQGTEKVIERVSDSGVPISKIGRADGDGQFRRPRDVVKDSNGSYYVLDAENYRVQKFDSAGNFLKKIETGGVDNRRFTYPLRLAVDKSNNLFVLDNLIIYKFDSNGNFLVSFGSQGTGDGQFNYPRDLKIDNEDNIYILNFDYGSENTGILKFDNNGQFVSRLYLPGQGEGQLAYVNSFAIDGNGDFYIHDYNPSIGGYRLQHFSNTGTYLNQIPTLNFVGDLEVDQYNNLYTIGYKSIFRIKPDGTLITIFYGGDESSFQEGGFYIDPTTQKLVIADAIVNQVIVAGCSLPEPKFSVVLAQAGSPTLFIDESTHIAPSSTYRWDYGDGTTNDLKGNTEHIYNETKEYTATLTIDQTCISGFSKTFNLTTSLESDSLTLVDFYHKANGANWINNNNWLTGDIGTWYGVSLKNGRVAGLEFRSNNNIQGSLPSSLTLLEKLERLVISNNSIENGIPTWFEKLKELNTLILSNSQLTGKLSESVGSLVKLDTLDLSSNHLTDTIPASLGQLSLLRYLDLANNSFEKNVPSSFSNLTNAVTIRLANNDLNGLPDLSSISSLETLSVEGNQLSFGDIEPNLAIQNFTYSPQKNIHPPQNSLTFYETGVLSLSVPVSGSANQYQWFQDGKVIEGANASSYNLQNITRSDAGQYQLQITSTVVTDLTLLTSEISVSVVVPPDNDQDGYSAVTDCNDADPTIYPGAKELCDAKDNNCDGNVDNGCTSPQLWGLAASGGPGQAGTIFSLYADGSNAVQVQHAFKAELQQPLRGNLLELPDGSMIGMTAFGGGNNYGGIFRQDPDGTQHVLYSFSGLDGAYPYGSLILGNDGLLYGMTSYGGNQFQGNIFKIKTDGTSFATIHSFYYSDGSTPFGSLIQGDDGSLYGMTLSGGTTGAGVIFKTKTDGRDFLVMHNFTLTEGGGYPFGSLIQTTDGALFGMNQQGGTNGFGTIFKINPDGTSYAVLHNFDGINGASPQGSLLHASDNSLYGMTVNGGTDDRGTIFKMNTDGNDYSVIHNFNYTNGAHPFGALIQATDGLLYGLTQQGGNSDYGTVFKINPDGASQAVIHNFNSINGANPYGSLIQGSDYLLYGMTQSGGSSGIGTIFKVNLDGSNFYNSHNFIKSKAAAPIGSLMKSSGELLYGVTLNGGPSNYGSIFRINTDGTGHTVVHNFIGTDGMLPYGSLIEGSDGYLYGTTANGGTFGFGTIYKLNADGSNLTVLHQFTRTDGPNQSSLIQATNGSLYGVTGIGGTSDNGTIFKINTDGSGYSIVHNFIEQEGNLPRGSLLQSSSGALYGMTIYGGKYGYGTVYRINLDGTEHAVIYDFDQISGSSPYGSLIQGPDGKLYAMTFQGGSNNAGTIFRINDDGTNYTVLHNFDGITGLNPDGSLLLYQNELFGYTKYGGQQYGGVVFKYDLTTNTFNKLTDLSEYTGKLPENGSLLLVNQPTINFPTQSASNISFNDVTNRSMTINFLPGNGEKRVVLMAEESTSLAPVNIMDGTELTGNANFTLATEYQTGWKVVYSGSESTIAVTGLRGDTNYQVTVIEYNGAVTETRYRNEGAPMATQKTLPDVLTPTVAASNITFSAISYSTMQVNFVKGNGEQRLIVMKEGSAPSFTPDNDSFFTGSLENGESVVYNGSGSSISLSDLLPGTTYYLKIFEFNTDSTHTQYLIAEAPSASQRTIPDVLAPTVSASAIHFTSITPISMKLNFTAGDGEQRLIVMKSGSQPSFIPVDDAFYSGTVNAGETVIYNGSGNSVDLFNLQPGATYYLKVFEFNTDSTRTRYLTSTAPVGAKQTPQLPAVYLITPADGSINQNANVLKVTANKLDRVKTYTIELSSSSDFDSGVLSKSGLRNQTFSGLDYNTKYFARVKTNLSPFYGKVTSFTTAPPQYFTYVISPADGAKDVSTSITVSSNSLPEATRYTIELNTSSNFDGLSKVKTAASPNILFTGLNKRTTYYARVFTNLAQGVWGKSTSFTTGNVNKLNPAARDTDSTEEDKPKSDVLAVDILENPFKQLLTLTIKTPGEEEATVKLSDMTGKIIFQSSEKTNRTIEIDRPIAQGVYLIHVRTATGSKIVRVVKVD